MVETEQKVPLLGDIPLLGALFRYTSVKKVKNNLMVFLRPTILRTQQDSHNLTSRKYNFMRRKQLEMRVEGVKLLPDESHPLLPESEEFMQLPPPFGPAVVDMRGAATQTPASIPSAPAAPATDDAEDDF